MWQNRDLGLDPGLNSPESRGEKNLQYPRFRPGRKEVQNYMVGSVGVNWVPLG